MKETFNKQCYVNGNKCRVMGYENGLAVLGCFGSWWASHSTACRDEFREMWERGEIKSMRGVQGAIKIPTPDAAGIRAVIPGAEIVWEGSKEFDALRAAAEGSRPGGGNKTGKSATGDDAPTPTVAAADAFQAPGLESCPVLADMIGKMAPVVYVINDWAAEYSAAILSGGGTPADPAPLGVLAPMLPGLADAFGAYKTTISTAAAEYQEKQAAEAAARAAAEDAAKKAAAAAANGKTLVKLWNGETVEVTGRVHPAFAEVLEDLKDSGRVYLYGPAGTGKSYMARQIAEALGLDFWQDGKADLKYDLVGSTDINGQHVPTALTNAWRFGGVWLWDEVDRSAADACTAINNGLANGEMWLPGLGMVKMHPDFKVIGTGNTIGFGSEKYAGAQVQDLAVMSRFISKIRVDYCREMDEIVTGGDTELCDFVQQVRAAIAETGVNIDLAIRLLKPMQEKARRRGERRALECGIFAGLEKTQIRLIADRCNGRGKWFDALRALAA